MPVQNIWKHVTDSVVLLDLQKAFDTVAHSVLLIKLEAICWEMILPIGFNPTGNNLWIIMVPIQNLSVSRVGFP